MYEIGKNYMDKRQLNLNARTTIKLFNKLKANKQLITKINKQWVNFLFPPSDYLKPGTPLKNLNRGRVSDIIGKTVPIFRRPETEGKLCGGGSALRDVKLIVLSSE